MILVLTNADTEILALRAVVEGLPPGFPPVRAANPCAREEPPVLSGVEAVVARLLGGRRAWDPGFDEMRRRCLDAGVPLLACGGEATPDAELTALSTVPSATVAQAFAYLSRGGLANLENLLRFVADTVLLHGFGFDPPADVPDHGLWERPHASTTAGPVARVGVVFYRAHLLSGNTQFVEDLCAALEARGARAVPVWCYSLRPDESGRVPALDLLAGAGVDVVVTTVLASGSTTSDGDGARWSAPALAALDVPVVQAVAATSSSAAWEGSSAGLAPVDVAMGVALPEFDGRIVTVPFSFKEVVDDGDQLGSAVSAYRTVPDRAARVAGIAVRLAALRHRPSRDKRVALVLSAYPTKRSRIGNAVALDTPASVVALLHSLADAGYRVDRVPAHGDALMAELIDAFSYERETLTADQLARAPGRLPARDYEDWFATLPHDLQIGMKEAWGAPPGDVYRHGDDLVFAGLDLGNVVVAVQPPRGFGDDAVAVYHSPDLAPTHHYLAFYRWLDRGWGADAVVHVGKHGTLEWLPGKGVGLSASCHPDVALGDLPLVYPFVVNDPGEGTQAKRRAHAVIVDHLVAPMTRAETYDDLARLESLLDEYYQVQTLDPSKLPAIRRRVWEVLVRAEVHRDLGLGHVPEGDAFDDVLPDIDGYLCELKDAQVRGGLHTLGAPPDGDAELDLVLALTRLPQGDVASLRAAVAAELGVDLASASRHDVDEVDARSRRRLAELQEAGWAYRGDDPVLGYVCRRLVPALRRTGDEVTAVLAALDGRYVEPGPSGSPTRGMAHVLPTGRNFYSIDPKAIPSRLSWEVGEGLAAALLERHLAEEGAYPQTVGLVLWGTAAMRTQGDDVAEALALLGVRPVWAEESGRVTGLEVVSLEELGRPRVDVTLRISGFFRDAFPNLVHLLDDAVALVVGLDEDPEANPVRAHGAADPRVFGPKPGGYGSGILPLIESGHWRSDEDLAGVYVAWSGFAYGRDGFGVPAEAAMRRRFGAIEVAVKNQDNREHDIFDSDDYLQDHGGMVATVRHLTGSNPKAWFGDSADPSRPRVRSLAEEAARVVRTRVLNPKWISAMQAHGYKGAFEMAATVDYLFGYDATAHVVEDWMYERVTEAYVTDPAVREFFRRSNPWALRSIAERLLEAADRDMWQASDDALTTLRSAVLESEGWEEER
ncbi:MAG TPA: cobaltochelatase subunit CobN [Acidimicrobiales bacterium]|nr:cobaltochelatase subunit CobN [Acidimicrobiales bacterium]